MTARSVLRMLLAIAFATAGVLHLLFPEPFIDITPDWVPMASDVVRLTGLAEMAGALGLIIPRTRRWAGVALAAYCVCVFPANVKHAVIDLDRAQPLLGWGYHIPRLLLQPVIVWCCLWAGAVIDWPFRRKA